MKKEEIAKLESKVSKDPSSTLFVPLAEEYRKQGRLDDAVDVLKAGIERQPSYMSARVALGRIFFEKSLFDEARSQFETVIEAIPDNLFARQRLADIYEKQGEFELARAQVEEIIRLNPTVFDGERFRNDLAPRLVSEGWSQSGEPKKDASEGDEIAETDSGEDSVELEESAGNELTNPGSVSEEGGSEVESRPESEMANEVPEAKEQSESEIVTDVPEMEEPEPMESDDLVIGESVPDDPGIEKTSDDLEVARDIAEPDLNGPPPARSADPDPDAELSREAASEIVTESMARVYIEQEHYEEALAVYEKLYKKDSENRKLLQSLTDLKMLLSLEEQRRAKQKFEKREETLGKLGGFLQKVRRWGNGVS